MINKIIIYLFCGPFLITFLLSEKINLPTDPLDEISLISTNSLQNNRPIVVSDNSSRFHVFWLVRTKVNPGVTDPTGDTIYYSKWSNGVWSNAVDIIAVPHDSFIDHLSATVDQSDRIHLVWSGIKNYSPAIFYSYSEASKAESPKFWSEPLVISILEYSSTPSIASYKDELHLIYTDIEDEVGSLYYVSSKDRGNTWSLPESIPMAGGQKRAVFEPVIATDDYDCLHIAWGELLLPGAWPPTGVMYARKCAPVNTWEKTFEYPGEYSWIMPILQKNNVYLTFSGDSTVRGRFIAFSQDEGKTWKTDDVFPRIGGLAGFMPLLFDEHGKQHLVTTGLNHDYDNETLMDLAYYSVSQGTTWQTPVIVSDLQDAAHFPNGASIEGKVLCFVWQDVLDPNNRSIWAKVIGYKPGELPTDEPPTKTSLTTEKSLTLNTTLTPTLRESKVSSKHDFASNVTYSSTGNYPITVGVISVLIILILVTAICIYKRGVRND